MLRNKIKSIDNLGLYDPNTKNTHRASYRVNSHRKGINVCRMNEKNEYQQNIHKFIVNFGYTKQFDKIYGVYGYRVSQEVLPMIRKYVQTILQQKQKMIIVYFTHAKLKRYNRSKSVQKAPKLIGYDQFKNQIIKKISVKLTSKIKSVIILHESFLTKSLKFFTTQKVFTKVQYCSNLCDLVRQLGPLFQYQCIPQQIIDYDGQTINWLNMYTLQDKKKARSKIQQQFTQVKQKRQVKLQRQAKIYKKSILQYPLNHQKIPKIVQMLIEIIAKQHCKLQGIFRKSYDSQKFDQLQQLVQLIQDVSQDSLYKFDGYILANFLKKILYSLDPPLLDKTIILNSQFDNYSDRSQTNHEKFKKKCSYTFIQSIPPTNIEELWDNVNKLSNQNNAKFLQFLIHFLQNKIIPNSTYNKINQKDLAIIFVPCIFGLQVSPLQNQKLYKKCISLIQALISQQFTFTKNI